MNEIIQEAIKVLEEEREVLLKWIAETKMGGWSTVHLKVMEDRAGILFNKINEFKVRLHGL